jgi:hypothetical protein
LDVVLNKLWKFIIPSTLTPRYSPCDLQDPHPKITNIDPDKNTFKWFIKGHIKGKKAITDVMSTSHDIYVDYEEMVE